MSAADALASLLRRGFDADMINALSQMVTAETSKSHVVEVSLQELKDGMVLAEDVFAMNGTLLLARGHTIKANVINRLRGMRPNLANRQTLRVHLPE